MLERIIFNRLFRYFLKNECQSDFLLGDSCISQLLSITHEIYRSFDCNPSVDVRGIYLDISKAFGKVWHDGLIYKLKFVWCRKQTSKPNLKLFDKPSVTCSSQRATSKWTNILAGVLGPLLLGVLGPLLFLISINDLPDFLK